jgi:hypothetical protein
VIRFGTLWFGVIVGLVALALVSRELGRAPQVDPTPEAAAEGLAPP